MESKKITMIVAVLILGTAIGGGVGYYLAPTKTVEKTITVTKHPLEGQTIQVGSCTSVALLEIYTPYTKQVVLTDVNDYLKKLGYNINYNIKIDEASTSTIYLEKVQAFKSQGIDVMTAYSGSSYVMAVLPYINQNNMLLITPGATSPLLSAKDNFFRLTPTDYIAAPAIAEMLWSWGIKYCLFIELGDAFGDGIWNIFEKEYPNKGGVILDRIRYSTGTVEFSSYVETANRIITDAIKKYGAEKVGIEFVGGDEIVTLITQASRYPALMSVYWFSSDTTIRNQRLPDDAPKETGQVKFFGPFPSPGYSEKYTKLAERFTTLTKLAYNFNYACQYDISWILINSILESGKKGALDIIPLIPHIADQLYGASGWCTLDEYGDRKIVNMEIRGFGVKDGKIESFIQYGQYDGVTKKVTWDTSLIIPGSKIPEWNP